MILPAAAPAMAIGSGWQIWRRCFRHRGQHTLRARIHHAREQALVEEALDDAWVVTLKEINSDTGPLPAQRALGAPALPAGTAVPVVPGSGAVTLLPASAAGKHELSLDYVKLRAETERALASLARPLSFSPRSAFRPAAEGPFEATSWSLVRS